ncbi:MAG: hypothetical protein ACEQSH_00675 [Bacteroidia bacterium]
MATAAAKAETPQDAKAKKDVAVVIKPPRLNRATVRIIGTAPLVQCAFSAKALNTIRETQEAGSQARAKKKREARNFDADFEGAIHRSLEGWIGIPAPAFRAAMIDACRLVGYKMTLAKLAIFVEADGIDAVSGQPLVRLNASAPIQMISAVRNATGVIDLRARPRWDVWSADLRLIFDEDVLSTADVTNLLMRAGMQVGIGEGRPNSRMSFGQGWGLFKLETE